MRANYKICIECGQPIVRVKKIRSYGSSKRCFSFKENREYMFVAFRAPWSLEPDDDERPTPAMPGYNNTRDKMIIVRSRKYRNFNRRREHYMCGCELYMWIHEFPKNSDPKTLAKFSKKRLVIRRRT